MVMGIVLAFVLALDGAAVLPLERVLPEPVAMRVRMLSLREGMSEGEIDRRLGLTGRSPDPVWWTVSTTVAHYPVGQTHTLRLVFRHADDLKGPSRLSKAKLMTKDAK
jgi:hypothetical protein